MSEREIVLVAVASCSLAVLVITFVYMTFMSDEEQQSANDAKRGKKKKRKSQTEGENKKMASAFDRIIGHHNQTGALRPFRSVSFLFGAVPAAVKIYRQREADERARQRSTIDVSKSMETIY